jgi:hypothetical protein
MSRFTFDDTIRIKGTAPSPLRPGEIVSVTMVFLPEDRRGPYFERFPPGVVYSVEYETGESVDVHEDFLEGLH